MSASKRENLLQNLTRRDAQKPPMDVTYDAKGALLDQITERPASGAIDSNNNDDVAIDSTSNSDNDVNNNSNIDNDNDSNITSNNNSNDEGAGERENDAIDALLTVTRNASNKMFKGFYLDPDVAKVLERLAKKHGKGIQSQMVNEALRKVFKSKGLL